MGICSTWLKMKLVNISLYTVIDSHEYREILRGCRRRIAAVPLISSLVGGLRFYFPALVTKAAIRTVKRTNVLFLRVNISVFYKTQYWSTLTNIGLLNAEKCTFLKIYKWKALNSRERVPHVLEEFLSDDTGPGVNGQLHLADLLVDLLHEVDDVVHQLVFVHLLRVEVGNQEANIVPLKTTAVLAGRVNTFYREKIQGFYFTMWFLTFVWRSRLTFSPF